MVIRPVGRSGRRSRACFLGSTERRSSWVARNRPKEPAGGCTSWFASSATCRLCPSEDSADPRHELARRERLGQVVVGAELEADDAIRFLVTRGQDQNRDVTAAAQLSTEGEAVDVGKAEVEHDEARLLPPDRLEAAFAGALTDDLEAGLLQVRADECADRFVVFDHDGDAGHGRIARIAVARLPTWSTATTSPSRRRRSRTRRPFRVTTVARSIRNPTRLPSS